jgi:DnaJ-class molecular chaperone
LSWKSDKVRRIKDYYQYTFKHKERDCCACNGSGWYDWSDPETGYHPKCGGCEGTGKETYQDIKDEDLKANVEWIYSKYSGNGYGVITAQASMIEMIVFHLNLRWKQKGRDVDV